MGREYYAAVFQEEGGGYYASFPDLPGCFTGADSLDELDEMMRDAVCVYLGGMRDLGKPIPEPSSYAQLDKESEGDRGFLSFQKVEVVVGYESG